MAVFNFVFILPFSGIKKTKEGTATTGEKEETGRKAPTKGLGQQK